MRLTFIVNNAAFFVSHRLPIADALIRAGHQVNLVTGRAGSQTLEERAMHELEKAGISHHRLAFGSQSLSPFTELRGLLGLILFLLRNRPDLVHCASPKAVLYGGIAARLCRVPAAVFALTGMGYAFTQNDKVNLLRRLLMMAFRVIARFSFGHRNKRVIVQNLDDWAFAEAQGLASIEELRLIPGSGVDLDKFDKPNPVSKQALVVFPARILRDKGVIEFVEAARTLRAAAPKWRFLLAGTADYRNPSSLAPEAIHEWQDEGVIDWLGHIEDMAKLFAVTTIACLPSYREGLPKALIEAAAAGCAIVTTDTIGCREAIIPGVTGDLVPLRDSTSLAQALLELINDESRCARYGEAGRNLAIERFSISSVIDQTLEIYAELC